MSWNFGLLDMYLLEKVSKSRVGSDNDADVPHLTVDDGFDNTIETNPFLDYGCAELNMMFAMAERYMVLPFLEEIVETSNAELCEEASDDSCVYIEIHQMKSCNQEPDTNPHSVDSDEADCFETVLKQPRFIAFVMAQIQSITGSMILKPVMTYNIEQSSSLGYAFLEESLDAVISYRNTVMLQTTFPVFFNMKEHTIYVFEGQYWDHHDWKTQMDM
ncbi:hypothetical protein HHK36_023417 [Tetracentron sinense]|uniref:Uncharacterized protein n=1 Tax=Tetracentron sinense TaxID=13715 RepID=A0A834YT48_TETSI|nr:hypothetical protein HHK36_023417 [Tetracentron sinense]